MQLKKIELQGFKSFVDKTEIEFLEGVTTIVGPNGSGKSNISDAIKWVLGEQSVKALRGSKMEDLIFAGTENRKKVGYAEVSMVLDNSDGVLPIEYSEVVVSRRIYRTGESGYYINDSECRLKDVLELFMDTGIGKDGYSIISQGKIDEILSNKSEDRRAIFEEASGIVKYRTRKDEALRKLEHTNTNLIRVQDVINEIEKNIGILEKKSETAKKFLDLRENLKVLDVKIFLQKLKESAIKLSDLNNILDTLENNKLKEEENAIEIGKAKVNIKNRLDEITEKIESYQRKYFETENELEKINSKIDITTEKNSNLKLNIERLNEEILKDRENIEILENEIIKKQEKKDSLKENKVKFEVELKEKEEELKKITLNMDESEIKKEDLKKENEDLAEKRSEEKVKISSMETTISSNEKQINDIKDHESKKIFQKDSINAAKEDIYLKLTDSKNKLKQVKEVIEELSKKEEDYIEKTNKFNEKENSYKQEIMTHKSKFNYLNNLENENEGYVKSVKSVLEYSEKGKINTVFGTVASVISTEEKYETAIEVSIGGYLQNVIVQTDNDAKRLVSYLKSNSLGRATFLPLESIKKVEGYSSSRYKKHVGFIGMAHELVTFDKKYLPVIELILGKTAIVDNIDNAIKMSKEIKKEVKIVTLSGELISQVGSITGGTNSFKSSNIIGRKEKIETLKSKIKQLEQEYVKYVDDIKNVREELVNIKRELDVKKEEQNSINLEVVKYTENYNEELRSLEKIEETKINNQEVLKKLQEENQKLNKEIFESNADVLVINQKITENLEIIEEYARFNKEKEERVNFLNEDIVNLKISLSSFEESSMSIDEMTEKIDNDISNFNASIIKKEQEILNSNKEIEENVKIINEYKNGIEEMKNFKNEFADITKGLKEDKIECDKKLDVLEIKLLESIRKVDKIKEEKSKIENRKIKHDLEIENLKNTMWDNYELTISSAKDFLSKLNVENEEKENFDKEAEKLRKQIKELGEVDVSSIEEYKNTKERYDFLSTQKNDLEETKKKLDNLINNMTSIMKQQFTTQFKIINDNFNKVFKELFGGGKAELKLTDDKNILECGIDIEVQPPGKKLQSMLLLSGGERALTAISLLFAILKIKAPPFCILDEIEAALDDVNVQRFADYIKKYSDKSQFVVITHRKGTMEVASSVYGVTMQEYGVSKVISMKM